MLSELTSVISKINLYLYLNVCYPAKADIRQEALNLYFQSKAASQAPKKYAILLGWGIELLILIRYPLPEAALVTEACNLYKPILELTKYSLNANIYRRLR